MVVPHEKVQVVEVIYYHGPLEEPLLFYIKALWMSLSQQGVFHLTSLLLALGRPFAQILVPIGGPIVQTGPRPNRRK